MKKFIATLLFLISTSSFAQSKGLVCIGKAETPFAVWISEAKGNLDLKEVDYKIYYIYGYDIATPTIFKHKEWTKRNSSTLMFELTTAGNVTTLHLDGGRSGSLEFNLTEHPSGIFSGVVTGNKIELPLEGASVTCHYYEFED